MKRIVVFLVLMGSDSVYSQETSLPEIFFYPLIRSKSAYSQEEPFPIQFSISESKIVTEIPKKDKDFATIIPCVTSYIYTHESDYYKDYQRSYFAVTRKKHGWDCMRHYEILVNGCIPYFVDIDSCPENTMKFFPRELIKEAMNLEGVSYLAIDHSKFNKAKYYAILNKLLEFTRNHLTTKAMAEYVLETIKYSGKGKILFFARKKDEPDYLLDNLFVGLRELFQNSVVDIPKISFIYKSYSGDLLQLCGRGFSYTKITEDLPVDRENIAQRIQQREFDLIIYGSIHQAMPYFDLVQKHYMPQEIVYICGEDEEEWKCGCIENRYHLRNLFKREQSSQKFF